MKHGKPLDRTALSSHPLPPVVDGDKETKGRILILAGSREVPGAALLTATAAMRAGAGKLRIATRGEHRWPSWELRCPKRWSSVSLKTMTDLPHRRSLRSLNRPARSTASSRARECRKDRMCKKIADVLLASDARLALDAALLHSLEPAGRDRSTMPVLLPHAGELASLLDCDEEEIERDPISCGLRAAQRYRSVVLVKGVDQSGRHTRWPSMDL